MKTMSQVRVLVATKRIGSIPGCIPLAANDIGEGYTEDGERVYFAWGPNWTQDEAQQKGASIVLPIVDIGEVWDGDVPRRNYAPVISDAAITLLMPLMKTYEFTDDGAIEAICDSQ